MGNAIPSTDQACDGILEAFEHRYRQKKATNICVSGLIAILGITSFLYGIRLESISTIFRWMTVDGTVFTTLGAIAFIAINIVEVRKSTEMTRKTSYVNPLGLVLSQKWQWLLYLVIRLFIAAIVVTFLLWLAGKAHRKCNRQGKPSKKL